MASSDKVLALLDVVKLSFGHNIFRQQLAQAEDACARVSRDPSLPVFETPNRKQHDPNLDVGIYSKVVQSFPTY